MNKFYLTVKRLVTEKGINMIISPRAGGRPVSKMYIYTCMFLSADSDYLVLPK
jgi:hypothetical protein